MRNIQKIAKEIFAQIQKELIFEEWLKGKKFINTETNQPSPFFQLPLKQRLQTKAQYEQEMVELRKHNEEEKIRLKEIQKQKRRDAWTDAKIDKELKGWAKDLKAQEQGDDIEGKLPDLALSFLYQPGVKEFLQEKKYIRNPHAQREYITDILSSFI